MNNCWTNQKYHISDSLWRINSTNNNWSGGMGGDDWVFNASIVIVDNNIIPVWYEFDIDGHNNDFSFDKLKEFYKR